MHKNRQFIERLKRGGSVDHIYKNLYVAHPFGSSSSRLGTGYGARNHDRLEIDYQNKPATPMTGLGATTPMEPLEVIRPKAKPKKTPIRHAFSFGKLNQDDNKGIKNIEKRLFKQCQPNPLKHLLKSGKKYKDKIKNLSVKRSKVYDELYGKMKAKFVQG